VSKSLLSPSSAVHRLAAILAPTAVVAVALALRLYRFPDIPPGLHYDEAFNGLDAVGILEGHRHLFFPDIGGREPLQMYLEALAMVLFGPSVLAIRLPSVIAGAATAVAVYFLGREWFGWLGPGRRTLLPALYGALFFAVLLWPLAMNRTGYRANWLPVFSALLLLFLLRALRGGRPRDYLLAGLLLGLAQYTYLAARFLPVAVFTVLVIGWLGRVCRPRVLWRGAALLVGVSLLVVAPLAVHFWNHPSELVTHTADLSLGRAGGLPSLVENLGRTAAMFLFHGDDIWRYNYGGRPAFDPVSGACFVLGLAVCGVLAARDRAGGGRVRPAALALLAWCAVLLLPTVLSEGAPSFIRTFGALPVLVLLPALGLDRALRLLNARVGLRGPAFAAAAATLVFAFTGGATVRDYFFDYAGRAEPYYYFHTDFVEAAAVIRAESGPGRLLVDSELAKFSTIGFFLRGAEYRAFDARRSLVLSAEPAVYALPPAGPGITAGRLEALARLSGGALEERHDSRGRPMLTLLRKPAGLPAVPAGFGPAERPAAPVTFGEHARLLGYAFEEPAEAGRPLAISLAWDLLRPGDPGDSFSLKLFDDEDYLWAQRDDLPGGGTYPAHVWTPGERLYERMVLDLPPDLPPGRYRLVLTVYDRASGRNLPPVAGGLALDRVLLGRVTITAPSPLAAGARPPRAVEKEAASGLTLVGYDVQPAELRAGDPFRVHLYWRASAPIATRHRLALTLLGVDGRPAGERSDILGGAYPTDSWRAGDALHEVRTLTAHGRAAPGPSRLLVELPDSGATPLALAGPVLTDRERRWAVPDQIAPLGARLGGLAELVGYRAQPAAPAVRGGQVGVTLVWRALVETDTSYTAFVQVLDRDGRLLAQSDRLPAGGQAPTTSWRQGEIIEDRHELDLPPGPPNGPLHLIAGLYDAKTMQRLSVSGGADHVPLHTFNRSP
jgi:hypothetical protein